MTAPLVRPVVPVTLVSGIDEPAMLAAAMSVQLGLPGAVGVRHRIDGERGVLVRTVSDVTGVLEREEIDLAHACVSCAIREDVVPTLERLAATRRWEAIVACLPVTAEAVQVGRVLGWAPQRAPHVRIAADVAALDGASVASDLLGDELLDERGLAVTADDRRGVAEVATAIVEYADVVCLTELPTPEERSLLSVLARPGIEILNDPARLDASSLRGVGRRHDAAEAWVAEVRRGVLPALPNDDVWRLDLCSDRPLHPTRLLDELEIIGGGPCRARGCFWLPTRPEAICAWESAGGQASVGSTERWRPGETRLTRLVVTGLRGEGDPGAIDAAFARCLLTDAELARRGSVWHETWDGLEPWLGPIHEVA